MSGVLKLRNVVNSGTTINNLLTGSKFDYLPQAAVVKVFQVQDIVLASEVETNFTLGNVVVGDQLIPNVAAGANQGPKTNEDLLAEGVGRGGDRIQISVRETTGITNANAIVRTLIVIEDIL